MTRDAAEKGQAGAVLPEVTGVLSLLATPLVVFVSTATALYLENQDAFHRQTGVLSPFALAALGTLIVGAVLHFSSGVRISRWLLWAYYMVAPFFLLFSFLQDWAVGEHFFLWFFGTWPGGIALASALVAATTLAFSRLELSQVRAPLAVFGLLLLGSEAYSLLTRLEPATARAPLHAGIEELGPWADLPNIYHVILDGYDARDFPKTLDAASRGALEGFVNFPGNTAAYRSTQMSLPSIFSGRRIGSDASSRRYQEDAFNSSESLLYWLRKHGYRTLGYVPEIYNFELGLFDRVTLHRENLPPGALLAMNSASFQRFWLFVNMPRLVTRNLLGTEWFGRFGGDGLTRAAAGTQLPYSVPITSYFSFLSLLEEEAHLPGRGRYTLIHVIIPHRPEVFRSDCSYDEGGRSTTRMEQARCATRLLVELVERLRGLGRLDDSFVIVQADHGAYDEQGGVDANAAEGVSLSTLLMIKPVGRREDMRDSGVATTVLDVAPTILDAAGVRHELRPEGTSLLTPSRVPELQVTVDAGGGHARPAE